MSVITESVLRSDFKKEVPKTLEVQKSDILTPSAKQYLREKGVELKVITAEKMDQVDLADSTDLTDSSKTSGLGYKTNDYKPFEVMEQGFQPKFVSEYDGGMYEKKPEYMTHLYGNRLVFKDDARIAFRGKLDSFQSQILSLQITLKKLGMDQLVTDLEEILQVTRNILMSEVKDIPLQLESLFGLDESGIRAHSHNPKKYYGVKHFVPDVNMGEAIIGLNALRTQVRELEVAGMQTFRNGTVVKHQDIIRTLNRLSSAIYILMCRTLGEHTAEQ